MAKKYNIGDMVKIVIFTDKDGTPELIKPADMWRRDKDRISIHKVLVVGRDQRDDDLAVLIEKDVDPHKYIATKFDDSHTQVYDVDVKYHKKYGLLINQSHVYTPEDLIKKVQQIHMKEPGGINCCICTKFIQYASSDRLDGTYVCYNCKQTRSWMIPK